MNVKDAFHEVVQKILDTPELWQGPHHNSNAKTSTSGGNGGVPGGVQVVGLSDENKASGCGC